ncbi:hypothetical protein [Bradyrhizobium sp. USDA 4350]
MRTEKKLYEVTSEQWLRQTLAAEKMWRDMIRAKLTEGYVWNAERGCYVHPDGTELWVEG